MSETKGQQIVRRYEDGKKLRATVDQRVDFAAPFIDPTRSNIVTKRLEGQALLGNVYDNEGIYAADLCTKFIGSELHSPGSIWFSLSEERDELNDDDEVREWMQECRDRMLADARTSNFYGEIYETDKDWLIFGTGDFQLEERPVLSYGQSGPGYRGARFSSTKIGHFVAYEGGWNEIDSKYYVISLSARAAVERFGEQIKTQIPKIGQRFNEDKNTDPFTFIHGIYPRQEGDKTYGNKAMPFASCYVESESKEVVREGGYEENPFMVPRASRVFGEVYGRGLTDIAINGCLTLNTVERWETEGLAFAVKPPLGVANDAVLGTLTPKPWGITTLRLTGGRAVKDVLQPLNMGTRFDVTQIKAEEFRKSIRRAFYVDQLVQLMSMENAGGAAQKEMTAYEVAQKLNLLNKILGPIYGRWECEFGVPYVRRHFNLMYRRGAFSPPPNILLEQGGQIKVQFESPLARAQRMEEIQAMHDAIGDLAPVLQLQMQQMQMTGQPPDKPVLDNYDFDEYSRIVDRIRGVPAKITLSGREVATLRQSRSEQQQQQQQGQQMLAATKSMQQAAPMLNVLQGGKSA